MGSVAEIPDFVAAGVDMIRLWREWIRADPGLVAEIHHLGRPVWTTAGDASLDELEALIDSGRRDPARPAATAGRPLARRRDP